MKKLGAVWKKIMLVLEKHFYNLGMLLKEYKGKHIECIIEVEWLEEDYSLKHHGKTKTSLKYLRQHYIRRYYDQFNCVSKKVEVEVGYYIIKWLW